jgi:hypothetical protein
MRPSLSRSIHRRCPGDSSGLLRDVDRGSVTIVVVRAISTIGRDVKVLVAVIVIVADLYTHAIADALQASFDGHVLESAIHPLAVETMPTLVADLGGKTPFAVGPERGAPLTKRCREAPSLSKAKTLHNSAHYQRSSLYYVARDPSDASRASLALVACRREFVSADAAKRV